MPEQLTRLQRTMAVVGFAGFPLSGLVAGLVDSHEGTDTPPHDLYAIAGAHHTGITISALTFMLSAILTVPAAGAVLRLVRGRGVRFAQVGSALLVLGAFGHMGYATWQLLLARVPHDTDQAAMEAYLDRQGAVLNAVLLPLLIAVAVGALLAVIALRRTRLVPAWFLWSMVALFCYDLVLNSSSLQDTRGAVLFPWVALTALFGWLAMRIALGDVE